jgi:transposase
VSIKLLEGGKVKQIFELKGQGRSIRGIADDLGISKNTVKKYPRCPGLPKPKPRPHRPSPLDPFKERLQARLAEGASLPPTQYPSAQTTTRSRPGKGR